MRVPLVDLKARYISIKGEIDSAVQNVIDETAFVRGKYVSKFEEEYAGAYGTRHCISYGNGTDAIYIALKALGIGPGDEVITTALSWISSSETITRTGARVVFVDIRYANNIMANIHVSWLDPQKVRRMTIVGSEKMVVYDDIAENKIAVYDKGIDRMAVLGQDMDFDNPGTFTFNHRSGDVVLPKIKWREPLLVEIEHFVDCIQNGTKCLTGPDHARNVVAILENA